MITKNEYEKNIARALEPLVSEELETAASLVATMIRSQPSVKYLMLLSNEINYYTIFNIASPLKTPSGVADNIVQFLISDSFLKTRGEVKLIEDNLENEHIEIWIGETYFSLFICDSFIVNL